MRRVRWTTGTNRLLRELVGARSRGPLFVTERRPTGDVATTDRDLYTGRARCLSYRRAHELFEAATAGWWALHQLRHTRLSHFGDDGVDLHALKAISGHKSFRSLEGYLHASDDAVKRVYDHRDPHTRRRQPPS